MMGRSGLQGKTRHIDGVLPTRELLIAANAVLPTRISGRSVKQMHAEGYPLVQMVEALGLDDDMSARIREILESLPDDVVAGIRTATLAMLDRGDYSLPVDLHGARVRPRQAGLRGGLGGERQADDPCSVREGRRKLKKRDSCPSGPGRVTTRMADWVIEGTGLSTGYLRALDGLIRLDRIAFDALEREFVTAASLARLGLLGITYDAGQDVGVS